MRISPIRRARQVQLAMEFRRYGIHLMPATVTLFAPIPTRGKPSPTMAPRLARRLATLGDS